MAVRPRKIGTSPGCCPSRVDSLLSPHNSNPGARLNKFERIRLVRYLELNTEQSVLVEDRADLQEHAKFLDRLDRRSVRTYLRAEETYNGPHFPIVSRSEFESNCLRLLDDGYSLIVAEPIDPADALLAGCIIRRLGEFNIEVAMGPGTVRRVTHEGRVDKALTLSGPDDPECTPEIGRVLNALLAAEERWRNDIALTDILYEFSVYRHPIGWKSEPAIFWEMRGLEEQDLTLERWYREVIAP